MLFEICHFVETSSVIKHIGVVVLYLLLRFFKTASTSSPFWYHYSQSIKALTSRSVRHLFYMTFLDDSRMILDFNCLVRLGNRACWRHVNDYNHFQICWDTAGFLVKYWNSITPKFQFNVRLLVPQIAMADYIQTSSSALNWGGGYRLAVK